MEITGHRHAIVTHDFSGGDSIRGELEGVRHIPSTGLSLEKSNKKFVSAGCFTSDVVALPFTSNEMVLTWNAAAPGGARLLIEFRVRAGDGNWSMWYQLGSWKPEKRLKTAAEDPEYGPLLVDHLVASRPFDEVRYRFNFSSQAGGQTPLLRRVTICVTDRERRDVGIPQRSGAATDLPVPWLSQRDMKTVGDLEMIAAGVCAATSVAMVLRYLGVNVSVREIARRAYDPNARIFGNWAYLIAAASEYGAVGWVQRFENLGEIEKMLLEGTPVIASISYKRGDLRIKPDRQSVGHLLVVRGVIGKTEKTENTENGDFICNDPDFENRSEGDGCVLSRLEFARAFFCHGAVGLILKRVTGDG